MHEDLLVGLKVDLSLLTKALRQAGISVGHANEAMQVTFRSYERPPQPYLIHEEPDLWEP